GAVADPQRPRRDEGCSFPVEKGDIRGFVPGAVGRTALGDGVDTVAEDALLDALPIHVIQRASQTELVGGAEGASHVRGVDEHLRGDAADVDAGATEDTLLDDGDGLL